MTKEHLFYCARCRGEETRMEIERDRLMDAHFVNQIRQKKVRTASAVAFRGPARQHGSGGLGAFAMRMSRVAMPLVNQYVMPKGQRIWKELTIGFVPEISNVISGQRLCCGKR